MQDAEWGCQLVEHGLVRASFVPPRPLRELRDLVRYRKAKIQERVREVQRVEKTLQDAGIKLSSVASEVLGVSARRMLDALISGTHDPDVLAELAKGALRKKIPALREALQGRFTGHHALLIGQMLAQIDFLDETIATLSERIEELTRPFSRELELLDTIPGVDKRAAELILSDLISGLAGRGSSAGIDEIFGWGIEKPRKCGAFRPTGPSLFGVRSPTLTVRGCHLAGERQ